MLNKTIFAFILLILSTTGYSQSIVDSFSDSQEITTPANLVNEDIIRISDARRIFVITNNQDSYAKGDFVTILIDEQPICRGLVAKTTGQISAVKITKIYSLDLFNSLRQSMTVQILRGDDSFYRLKKDTPEKEEFKVEGEDELFDETTILSEDMNDDARKGQIIKNDNLLSFGIGLVDGYDEARNPSKNQQMNISYGYQLNNNIWLEGFYGTHQIKGFPNSEIDTVIYNIALRIKYAVDAPFNSVIMPYFGYQSVSADSPGAGESDSNSDTENKQEIVAVDSLKKSRPIFGVTGMRRIVPGWFVKLTLGTDIINGGLALEF